MSNWLSRAFARICGRPVPKAAEDLNRAAANTNRKTSSTVRPVVQRRRSSSGPSYSYGSRSRGSSDSGTTYYHYDSGSHGSYDSGSSGSCDSGGGGDGGGGGD